MLLVHVGPQMRSFSIKIIGLSKKQDCFDSPPLQKKKEKMKLIIIGIKHLLSWKFKKWILLPAGINSLLFLTYLFCLLNQKQSFNQEGGTNQK